MVIVIYLDENHMQVFVSHKWLISQEFLLVCLLPPYVWRCVGMSCQSFLLRCSIPECVVACMLPPMPQC